MKVKCSYFIVIAVVLMMLIPSRIKAKTDIILVNPGFEAGTQDPWYWWGEAGTGTYGVSEYAHSGRKSVRMVADGDDHVPMGFLQEFKCMPGVKVTVNAWVMSPSNNPLTNSNAFVKLEFWGEDPINPLELYESKHLSGAFDWKNVTVSGKVPQEAIKVKIGLFIWNRDIDHSGAVYFDDANALVGKTF